MAKRNDPKLLIFDCDPGCDDALAIVLVAERGHYNKIDLLTVAGNVSVEQTTSNACRVVSLLHKKKQMKVYRGCSRSLVGDLPSAASVHGRDGLGDTPNSLLGEIGNDNWVVPEAVSAVARLIELSSNGGEPFDLLCTGPLTNLATALNLMNVVERRCFWEKCNRFVVMGGCFNTQGNITCSAEFNVYFDPVALQMVLDVLREVQEIEGMAKKVNTSKNYKKTGKSVESPEVYFVSLDVSESVAVSLSEQSERGQQDQISKFLFYALQKYGEFHAFHCRRPDQREFKSFDECEYLRALLGGSSGVSQLNKFCYLHDPLAAWVMLDFKRCNGKFEEVMIRVDTGRGESRGRIISCSDCSGSP